MKAALSIDTTKAAALFIDLQEEHRRDSRYLVEGFGTIIANVQRLQQAARRTGIPVLHAAYKVDFARQPSKPFHPVMADGTSAFSNADDPLSAICGEVAPVGGETVFVKADASTFAAGDAALRLKGQGLEWLFVAGVWTEACVAATVKDAVELGFRVVLVKDACGSGTTAMHQIGILNIANRLYGGAVTDTAGACRMMDGETVEAWAVKGAAPLRFTYENAADLYKSL